MDQLEECEEEDGDEEEEDEEIGEMKAKFDKIMANFAEENKRQPAQQQSSNTERERILDFKNRNLQQNVRGIIQKEHNDRSEGDASDNVSAPRYEAVYDEPDNKENSINIKINSKNFPNQKPPMPLKSALKN